MEFEQICEQFITATNHFSEIISTRYIVENYPALYWGGNGIGNRFARKKFNYSVIYSNGKIKKYSTNDFDEIPVEKLEQFLQTNVDKTFGILGIFIHSVKTHNQERPISSKISKTIKVKNCVSCGSYSEIVCDHKNDLYNDSRVLSVATQTLDDFQPLCNHCNLQKRQVNKIERTGNKIYSAKNIIRYAVYPFEFPWEKKNFDVNDPLCKVDTYWYDPVEFDNKICKYMLYIYPLILELHKINKKCDIEHIFALLKI